MSSPIPQSDPADPAAHPSRYLRDSKSGTFPKLTNSSAAPRQPQPTPEAPGAFAEPSSHRWGHWTMSVSNPTPVEPPRGLRATVPDNQHPPAKATAASAGQVDYRLSRLAIFLPNPKLVAVPSTRPEYEPVCSRCSQPRRSASHRNRRRSVKATRSGQRTSKSGRSRPAEAPVRDHTADLPSQLEQVVTPPGRGSGSGKDAEEPNRDSGKGIRFHTPADSYSQRNSKTSPSGPDRFSTSTSKSVVKADVASPVESATRPVIAPGIVREAIANLDSAANNTNNDVKYVSTVQLEPRPRDVLRSAGFFSRVLAFWKRKASGPDQKHAQQPELETPFSNTKRKQTQPVPQPAVTPEQDEQENLEDSIVADLPSQLPRELSTPISLNPLAKRSISRFHEDLPESQKNSAIAIDSVNSVADNTDLRSTSILSLHSANSPALNGIRNMSQDSEVYKINYTVPRPPSPPPQQTRAVQQVPLGRSNSFFTRIAEKNWLRREKSIGQCPSHPSSSFGTHAQRRTTKPAATLKQESFSSPSQVQHSPSRTQSASYAIGPLTSSSVKPLSRSSTQRRVTPSLASIDSEGSWLSGKIGGTARSSVAFPTRNPSLNRQVMMPPPSKEGISKRQLEERHFSGHTEFEHGRIGMVGKKPMVVHVASPRRPMTAASTLPSPAGTSSASRTPPLGGEEVMTAVVSMSPSEVKAPGTPTNDIEILSSNGSTTRLAHEISWPKPPLGMS